MSNTPSDTDACCNIDRADTDSDPYTHADAYANTNLNGDRHAYSDTHSYPNAHADAHVDMPLSYPLLRE